MPGIQVSLYERTLEEKGASAQDDWAGTGADMPETVMQWVRDGAPRRRSAGRGMKGEVAEAPMRVLRGLRGAQGLEVRGARSEVGAQGRGRGGPLAPGGSDEADATAQQVLTQASCGETIRRLAAAQRRSPRRGTIEDGCTRRMRRRFESQAAAVGTTRPETSDLSRAKATGLRNQ